MFHILEEIFMRNSVFVVLSFWLLGKQLGKFLIEINQVLSICSPLEFILDEYGQRSVQNLLRD